jgi:predicted nucleic acid-binding protein
VIVIESSAMVDAIVGDPANPDLLALLADEELHAPALLDFEVASALRGHALEAPSSAPTPN